LNANLSPNYDVFESLISFSRKDFSSKLGILHFLINPISNYILRARTPKDRHRVSMHKIAEDQNRSPQTINRHIKDYNKEVMQRGYCLKCRRVQWVYAEE
jgi:hypothetical protein